MNIRTGRFAAISLAALGVALAAPAAAQAQEIRYVSIPVIQPLPGKSTDAPKAEAPKAETGDLANLVSQVEIPFEEFQLENGLTVVVHEDRKAPIVGVAVWYNVGSKDEPKGKTGFAHLFEHLMFNGSENAPADYFQYLQEMGATDYNGTTNFDRTNYFQTVPRPALERAL